MTVFVNYGAGSVAYSVFASPAFTNPTSAQVQARGDSVYGYLTALEAVADDAGDAATDRIIALRDFSAAVGTVQFDVPPAPNMTLVEMAQPQDLVLDSPEVGKSDLDDGFRYTIKDAKDTVFNKPADVDFTAPPEPGLTTPGTLPNAPADYDFPDLAVPELDIQPYTPTTVIAPDVGGHSFESSAGDFPIDGLDLTIDTSGLQAAIDAYADYNPVPPTLPEYTYLIPEVFTVTSAMTQGGGLEYQVLMDPGKELVDGIMGRTDPAFTRRGLYRVPGAAQYDEWLKGISNESVDQSNYVFDAKARDSLILASFQLGTAAHRLLVDIETALYDLEFQAAKAVVTAALEQAQAVTALYNAEMIVFRGHVEEYNALAASIGANAQAFEVLAREVRILGTVNATTASAFSTAERAKISAARTFKAQVQAEAAKLTAYRAYLESYEAQVQSARAAVESYRGDVTRYAAEMERLTDEYDLYATNARATQTENAALASGMQAYQTEIRSVAARADASASEAVVKSIELQARAAVDETAYIKRTLHNNEVGTDLTGQAGIYNIDVSNYVAELTAEASAFSSTSAAGRAISSYVTSASEAVGRAASLSQTANIRLSAAYEEVYKAAGRAGAAVASGKLSGFRASATMSAKEALNASRSYGVAYTNSGSNNYSESDNYSAQLSG